MLDKETVDFLPLFLEEVKKLGFIEKLELSSGVEEKAYIRDDCKLFVFPRQGIWLLEKGEEVEANGNFVDTDVLRQTVEQI